ncbi:hypothetical protein ABL850_14920 [Variovorax paradoxus]|uniref:hypothetical protein n=1 Tax=Variovorax paradoxus TaxID=34073 RepID=UPI003AAE7349
MQLHIAHATINLQLPSSALEQIDVTNMLSSGSVASAFDLTPPARGKYWAGQGGHYICTQPALLGLPARHLVFGASEAEDLAFGPSVDVPGAKSQLDGRANTTALLTASRDHAAAKWASEYEADGHSDFHLPSRMDLLMAYVCAPSLFKKSGWYWSSTQGSRSSAFVQDFEVGFSFWGVLGSVRRVRACRWIHLNA